MMKKEKTPTLKKKSLKRWSRLANVGKFASVGTPFALLCVFNRDTYFATQLSTIRVTSGFIMAALTLCLAVYLINKKNVTNSLVTVFIGWGIALGILWLIEDLLQSLITIMFWIWLGIGGALGLDMTRDSLLEKIEKIQRGIDKFEEEETVEACRQEKLAKEEKKKVRF